MVEIVLWSHAGPERLVGKPTGVEFEEAREGYSTVEPTFVWTYEMVEEFLTQQWREGFRPEGWMETTPAVPTHDIERLAAENERLRHDLAREKVEHRRTGKRLDSALEIIGMEPSKRRLQVRRGGNGNEQETQDP